MTLPDATVCEGRSYLFKDEDGKAKDRVTLQPVLGQTIDGATSFRFKGKRYVCELYSDGCGWQLLRSGVP